MKKKMYIVINIGCIECGVSSELVGAYKSKAYAKKVASQQNEWRDGGQSYAKVFEVNQ